ncbi:MAG: AI-2E family transporter [Anaerolineae bacterium]|nr:AI-2E family transporter [Anaerolineae bacterium]
MESAWTMRRIALATLTVVASAGVAWALYQVRDSLIVVFVGILFGMAMKGPVVVLQELYFPRWLALVLVLVVVLAVLPLAVVLLLPTLVNAVTSVVVSVIQGYETLLNRLAALPFLPSVLSSISLETVTQNLVGLLTTNSERLVGSALGVGTTIVGTLVNLITIITIGFLWLLEEERIRAWLINLAPPQNQPRAERIWQAVEAQVGGYLRGLLVLSLIVGVVSSVGYGVIGLPLALAFGILAGLMEIIPIPGVGLTLQVIIVGLATLSASPSQALGAVIWTIIVFQAANMILFPRIMGNAVGISALGVIIALLIFVSLLGGVGALLAIPLASMIQIIVDQSLTHSRLAMSVENGASATPARSARRSQAELLRVRDLLAADTTLSPAERGMALEHIEAALQAVEPLQASVGSPPPGRPI